MSITSIAQKKNSTRVVFLDIDGTLICKKQPVISDRVLAVLKKVQQEGHKVFLNTGRAISVIPKDLLATFPFDGIVAGCGSYIQVEGKVLLRKRLRMEFCSYLAEMVLKMENKPYCLFGGEILPLHMNMKREGLEVTSPRDFWEKYDGYPVTKASLGVHDDEPMPDFGKYRDEITIYRFPHYIEVVPKGYTKATGITMVMKALHLPEQNSIAIGDSYNDLEMIRQAGVGIVMGNAVDDVKAAADFVTLSCEEEGVAVALERYFSL